MLAFIAASQLASTSPVCVQVCACVDVSRNRVLYLAANRRCRGCPIIPSLEMYLLPSVYFKVVELSVVNWKC